MKSTKKDLEEAILFFAKEYKLEDSYSALMNEKIGFPRLIPLIVYDMFLNKFNDYYCGDEAHEHYTVLLNYGLELKEKGFVDFG
jgi:hypothetical protein